MEAREAAEILGYLSSAFPKNDLIEQTASVWIDQLCEVDFVVAKTAAKKLVAQQEWFPTVAQFLNFCRVETRWNGPAIGCENCDKGLVVGEDGTASFCKSCRPSAWLPPREPIRELNASQQNWRGYIEKARLQLEGTTRND
jgi:hypothetical protein